MSQAGSVLLGVMVTAVCIELLLCYRTSASYFRSIIPVFRSRVRHPARETPCDTWVDDADSEMRQCFAELAFRRISEREVAFWEPWRFARLSIPVFVAGRIVERERGELEVLAGPRWLVPIIWLAAFLGPSASCDTPAPVLLGVAALAVGILHYVRMSIVARALRHGPGA